MRTSKRPTSGLLHVALFGVAAMLFVVPAESARAQLFGAPRNTGSPLQIRPRPGTTTDAAAQAQVGTLQGNERFMRENRAASDFVGGSRQESGGFIGSVQALGAGRVPAATESLVAPTDDSRRLNRPLPAMSRTGLYPPKLIVDFGDVALDATLVRSVATERLRRLSGDPESTVEVSVEGRRAILRGTVADESTSRRLAILASFEPGIDDVENRLEIRPADDR